MAFVAQMHFANWAVVRCLSPLAIKLFLLAHRLAFVGIAFPATEDAASSIIHFLVLGAPIGRLSCLPLIHRCLRVIKARVQTNLVLLGRIIKEQSNLLVRGQLCANRVRVTLDCLVLILSLGT